ncbi:MAG: homoserine dehydrogenase [Chloroflexi bacterium]|nr:homoserine dehydrogenase [Chloroflexota bacterium]
MQRQPIFFLGFGGVGRALLTQILDAREQHRKRNGLKLDVLGIADSAGALVSEKPLGDAALRKALQTKIDTGRLPGPAATRANMRTLIAALPRNAIVVDTSASSATVPALIQAKRRGCGVVLANKIPLAGDLAWWNAIADARARWETTCGSAMPVIATLNTLLDSGDTVHRIEGTLSGTLGYVASQLEAGVKFGDAVRDAKMRGYTEPDPRQDLGGLDVGRKALILARMLGYRLDMQDVKVESLYPKHMDKLSVDDFMRDVDSLNETMAARVAELTADGHKLRYAAVIENGKLKAGFVGADPVSKLGMSRTSDSVVIFHTRFFMDNPLTVSGRGAGQDVTASGVLGDVVSLSRVMGNKLA